MTFSNWQITSPASAIIFDCDGTLSKIEGVNELAKHNNVYNEVSALTHQAMSQTGLNAKLYQQRLELICPHRNQVLALANDYYAHKVEDIQQIITLFQHLQKSIYLISAGINPAVELFGSMLNLAPENIFAVSVYFSDQGDFVDFDKHSPLIHNHGKQLIVEQIRKKHENIVYVGDGLNDLITYAHVSRLIGYGGIFYRENIAKECDYYITCSSMTPLLPLALTKKESEKLKNNEKELYQRGIAALDQGHVASFRPPRFF